jgi:hypothetical protein
MLQYIKLGRDTKSNRESVNIDTRGAFMGGEEMEEARS